MSIFSGFSNGYAHSDVILTWAYNNGYEMHNLCTLMSQVEHFKPERSAIHPEALQVIEQVWNQSIERLSPQDRTQWERRQQRGKPVFERTDPNLYKRLIGAASGALEMARAAASGKTVDLGGYVSEYVIQRLPILTEHPEFFAATNAENILAAAATTIAQRIAQRANESLHQLSGETLPLLLPGQVIEINFPSGKSLTTTLERVTGAGQLIVQPNDQEMGVAISFILGATIAPEQLKVSDQKVWMQLAGDELTRYEDYCRIKGKTL